MVAGEERTHPFSPKELHLPDYVPNLLLTIAILGSFAGASILVLALVWLISGTTYTLEHIAHLLGAYLNVTCQCCMRTSVGR